MANVSIVLSVACHCWQQFQNKNFASVNASLFSHPILADVLYLIINTTNIFKAGSFDEIKDNFF